MLTPHLRGVSFPLAITRWQFIGKQDAYPAGWQAGCLPHWLASRELTLREVAGGFQLFYNQNASGLSMAALKRTMAFVCCHKFGVCSFVYFHQLIVKSFYETCEVLAAVVWAHGLSG